MDFPKQKMRFTAAHGGSLSPQGWIVLDISNMDMDGVNQIYVSVADVEQLRAAGDRQTESLRKARELLGG
jgi:hypothetical protein